MFPTNNESEYKGGMRRVAAPVTSARTTMVTPPPSTRSGRSSESRDGESAHHSVTSSAVIVDLNIGGEKFTTSLESLRRAKGSFFESMFSCSWYATTGDGSVFIDRDPTHFRHILNFLRTGCLVSLPKEALEKEELAIEADFYGLEELVRAIRVPVVDVTEGLMEEVRRYREREAKLRAHFARRHDADILVLKRINLHEGLLPLFHPDLGLGELPLLYNRNHNNNNNNDDRNDGSLPESECLMMLREKEENKQCQIPVTVESLAEFRTNFNRAHGNILSRLTPILMEEPIVIAGGSVLCALTGSGNVRTCDWWGETSDIDLFLYCHSREEANRIARRVFYALAADHETWVVVRSSGVINMHRFNHVPENLVTKVQLVLRLYETPSEILIGFDVDCCCCAYDGQEVWMSPRCVYALKRGVNVLNPLHAWPNKASYELRLAKYAVRGFGVHVPELDTERIDFTRIVQAELSDLRGLARLIKVSILMESAALPRTIWDWPIGLSEREGRPTFPGSIGSLRGESINSMTEDEKLVCVIGSTYDPAGNALVFPSIYGHQQNFDWTWGDAFDLSIETRDPAWQEICDAPTPPDGVPGRLIDAWQLNEPSREYLNDEMDKFDLDSIYYSTAYKNI